MIPLYLLTGQLGSGKTTLLRHWLKSPELAEAAVVINEIGEVGLDDRLIASAVEDSMTLSNQCVCCSGLPGLQEALEQMWWDRLYRQRQSFNCVLVETTGLADPAPIRASLTKDSFLNRKFVLAGVITTISACADPKQWSQHEDLVSQIACAQVLILTKLDVSIPKQTIYSCLQRINTHAQVLKSSAGNLPWSNVLEALTDPPEQRDNHHSHHIHRHTSQARFIGLANPISSQQLQSVCSGLLRPALQRLKGVVCVDGALMSVQWSLGDADIFVCPFEGNPPTLGLTAIEDL
jgi:G3E family GTPase